MIAHCSQVDEEHRSENETGMLLRLAIVFLVVAVTAGVLGFTGLAGTFAWLAQFVFAVFLVLFFIGFITHLARGGKTMQVYPTDGRD